ncbi:phosphoethanolamine transferase [Massilia sp. CF038]|uniref:phosphoethanolamine transferase n=1 Tax=Massilia sp. CF038 TaxID=1881045 RepID=UPI0009186035|nr:phosphoethanolamine transferase [Massilia sp. CF038]SHH69290.1 Phosphoethanolamine transferase for glucans (OPG), alkaline phosphatase superfamily [Massilia sp. CF038]
MTAVLRPAKLFLLLTYLALSLVPFFPLLFGKTVEQPWQLLGVEVIAWVAIWAVFKRPAWFHWLLIPAFLALPTELYLYTYYGQPISTHHLGIIVETSPKEAMEFLGNTVWLMLAVTLAVIAWWAATWRIALADRELDWNDASRWIALAGLGAAAAVLAYGVEFGITPAATASKSAPSAVAGASWTGLSLPPLPHEARVPVELEALARSWPFGLVWRGIDFYNERQHLAELGERNSQFRFQASQANQDGAAQTMVMVIGESSRYDRWQLNGYERATNPLLSQEKNLVVLPDVITPVSATRLSVPVMISRKPPMQSLKDGFAEKSFLTAYKEAGFKTYWLSNQVSFGKFDTPVSVFAKEADVIQFMNLGGFTNHSNFDQILLGPLRNALADPAPRKLIVLHTLGSHWNYSQRHPKEFDHWQPSLFGIDKPVVTNTAIKPLMNNSYDNSVLYTDWFLAQVIGQLRGAAQRSAMVYVSDHGQSLYDNSCKLAFHGHNTQFDFHVPALLWYSDQFQASRPDKIAELARHRTARLGTENMFHTLLDLADIHYPGERLDWSFVNPAFQPHTRYVDSYGWSDYDNATLKGDCREIMDKGTPLKREK